MTTLRKTPALSNNGGVKVNDGTYGEEVNANVVALWARNACWLNSIGGTANDLTASADAPLTAPMVKPQAFWLVPVAVNTSFVTINVDSQGFVDVVDSAAGGLLEGALQIGVAYLLVFDGLKLRIVSSSAGASGLSAAPDYMIRDEKSSGTAGGTFTAGAWQTRDLNTELRNVLSGASLDAVSGQFTLPPGTFYLETSAPANASNGHQLRLFDVTTSSAIEYSTSGFSNTTSTPDRAELGVFFTITTPHVFRIEHKAQTTRATDGFGPASSTGGVKEVYAVVNVWKVGSLPSQVDGIAGGAVTFHMTFDTSTTDADPGTGLLRLNNATENAATMMYIDLTDRFLTDITALLDSLDDSSNSVKGEIRLSRFDDPTRWLTFNITAANATPSGYRKITLSPLASSATNPFVASDHLIFTFSRAGDQGAQGTAGSTGSGTFGMLPALENCAISATVASNILTLALKDKSGANPSAGSPCKIGFRSTTAASATWNQRSVTAALSMTVSAGSTLGYAASETNVIHVGFIDNAGTVEMCVVKDGALITEDRTINTTAEGGAGGADSGTTVYSTSARTGVPVRLAAVVLIQTGATAGNWSNAATRVMNVGAYPHTPFKNGIKAQAQFTTVTTTALADAFNVSSLTDNGTGDTTVNFAVAFNDANYAIAGLGRRGATNDNASFAVKQSTAPTASALRVTNLGVGNLEDSAAQSIMCSHFL
jgi:hypothetical protein